MTPSHPKLLSGNRRTNRGVSLIEVLIAVLILGIGMLGIAAMQAATLRNSQSSLQQSQAVIEANAMLDAMRANKANAGSYTKAMAAAPCTPPAAGATATLAAKDLHWFIQSLQDDLGPNSCGSIDNCPAGLCTVTVQWNTNATGPGVTGGVQSVSVASRL